MIDSIKIAEDYKERVLRLWLNPKYKRVRPDSDLVALVDKKMKGEIIPKLEAVFDDFCIERIDTAIARLVKELIPYLQSIDSADASVKFRSYYSKIKNDPRIIAFLSEIYDAFILIPIPFVEGNRNRAFHVFASNFETCLRSARGDYSKLLQIHESIFRANDEHWIKITSLMHSIHQVKNMKSLGGLEQLRAAAKLVGEITSNSVEPMVKHVGEIIAIVLGKKLPHEFRARINFVEASVSRVNLDISHLRLSDLAFIRNAVAHSGVSFDYVDEKIKLENVSKNGAEVRKYSAVEISNFGRLVLELVVGYEEYLKYGVSRFASAKGAKRQWIRNVVQSFQECDRDVCLGAKL